MKEAQAKAVIAQVCDKEDVTFSIMVTVNKEWEISIPPHLAEGKTEDELAGLITDEWVTVDDSGDCSNWENDAKLEEQYASAEFDSVVLTDDPSELLKDA